MSKNLKIKTFIISALSADGFIARDPNEPSIAWTSKEDKVNFVKLTKQAGVIVMGAKTFETIATALPHRRTIVYSSEQINIPGVETTVATPSRLIEKLEKEGVEELAVCGGATIYTMFMQAGLVDEIFITIEPIIFGLGLPLFKEKINARLDLLSSEKRGQSIFNHYKVIK